MTDQIQALVANINISNNKVELFMSKEKSKNETEKSSVVING